MRLGPGDGDQSGCRTAEKVIGMSNAHRTWNVLVTGGAGYVGSMLVPKLLDAGHKVTVLDLYLYGDVFAGLACNAKLRQVRGDLRNAAVVRDALKGCDAV